MKRYTHYPHGMEESEDGEYVLLNEKCQMRCRTCKYWVRKSRVLGKCHLNPPTVILTKHSVLIGSTSLRPVTYDSDFCSHYEQSGRWWWFKGETK